MERIRIGIIGTGGFANWHAERYTAIAGVNLEACMDLDAARADAFAAKHGFARAVDSVEEVLAACDAVSITTPEASHADLVLRALAAGRHVLCEKPLTVTLDEARTVAAAARRTGVVHMTNFSKRNAAAVVKAIELAESGALGDIRYAHASYFQSWVATPCWGHWTEPQWLWRLAKPASGEGGALTDIGSHMLDLLSALTGPLSSLRCSLASMPKMLDGAPVTEFKGRHLDANDTAIIEVRFTNPAGAPGVGVVQLTRWATAVENQERLEVFGTRGALRLDLAANPLVLHVSLGEDAQASRWTTLELPETPDTCRRFIDAIRAHHPAACDLVRGAVVQSYLDACERAAHSGTWESPAEI
ncbi:MAG: Gfo/Idh/MocA family oxidoreductase [Phycisphaeraceae bacterium]|nr:Gfo/Idh/MocA family oxidoreductase [Phycisphaeraceae bacterium]MCW5763801.1 Gfo/Idh/MocA family oxidoreductase [Phycisphaeraceae bacterium]